MKKREVFLLSALAFSVGTVFGFLISPAKNGINNKTQNYYGKLDTSNKEDSAIIADTCEKVQ